MRVVRRWRVDGSRCYGDGVADVSTDLTSDQSFKGSRRCREASAGLSDEDFAAKRSVANER